MIVLPGYPRQVQKFAEKRAKEIGINVLTEARVTGVTPDMLSIYDKNTKETTI